MLPIIVPPSNVLTEVANYVDFIKLITTAEGLADALAQLRAERKLNDDAAAELRTQRQANAAELEQIAARKVEANTLTKEANEKIGEAHKKNAEATERLQIVIERESQLEAERAAFEEQCRQSLQEIAAKEDAATKALDKAEKQLKAAHETKAVYEGKIKELKSIAG